MCTSIHGFHVESVSVKNKMKVFCLYVSRYGHVLVHAASKKLNVFIHVESKTIFQ